MWLGGEWRKQEEHTKGHEDGRGDDNEDGDPKVNDYDDYNVYDDRDDTHDDNDYANDDAIKAVSDKLSYLVILFVKKICVYCISFMKWARISVYIDMACLLIVSRWPTAFWDDKYVTQLQKTRWLMKGAALPRFWRFTQFARLNVIWVCYILRVIVVLWPAHLGRW